MVQKCIYCGAEITDDRPLTVCNSCGIKVWGEKMFRTIVNNMESAREKGDLELYKDEENDGKLNRKSMA